MMVLGAIVEGVYGQLARGRRRYDGGERIRRDFMVRECLGGPVLVGFLSDVVGGVVSSGPRNPLALLSLAQGPLVGPLTSLASKRPARSLQVGSVQWINWGIYR